MNVGRFHMLPPEMWRLVVVAERVEMMRIVSHGVRAGIDGDGNFALKVIVRRFHVDNMTKILKDVGKVVKRAKVEMLVLNGKNKMPSQKVKYDNTSELQSTLMHCHALQHLDLGHNVLATRGLASVALGLFQCTNLTVLDLRHNYLNNRGATILSDSLSRMSRLQRLNLSCNLFEDAAGAALLAGALKHHETLSDLDLSRNLLEDGGSLALGKALAHNTSLRTLNLMDNVICYDGLTWIHGSDQPAATMGLVRTMVGSLTSLNLERNMIRDTGVEDVLAPGLKNLLSLKELVLSDNYIGCRGAAAIGVNLWTSQCLETLDMRNNCVEVFGTRTLIGGIVTCTSLTTLNLSGNFIGANLFLEGWLVPQNMPNRAGVVEVDVRGNSISSIEERQISVFNVDQPNILFCV